MAIHIQNKTAESDESIDKLNKELALLNANMQELDIEKNGLQDIIDRLESKELGYKEKIVSLEASTAELEMVVAQNKSKSDQDVVNLKETFNDDLRILKDEHEINIRDLTMQLEIGKQRVNSSAFLILINYQKFIRKLTEIYQKFNRNLSEFYQNL